MGSARLCRFMEGYAAVLQLFRRAGENGFLVEHVSLATTVVDATLRMALVLKHQLDTKTSDVPEELLYQSEDDPIVSERQIYRRARDKGLLPDGMFEELEELYLERNKVVHRYVISEITTERVLALGIRYEKLLSQLTDVTGRLEEEQMRTSIGMTTPGEHMDEDELWAEMKGTTLAKHGTTALWHTITKKAT